MEHICKIEVIEGIEKLAEEERNLIYEAEKSAKKAYAPYSQFYVGAAVLLDNGEVFSANNQENSSFPVGTCAERSLLHYMGSIGKTQSIRKMAIRAFSEKRKLEKPIFPCGMCRQAMSEYEERSKKKWILLLKGDTDIIYRITGVGENLLPFSFKLEL